MDFKIYKSMKKIVITVMFLLTIHLLMSQNSEVRIIDLISNHEKIYNPDSEEFTRENNLSFAFKVDKAEECSKAILIAGTSLNSNNLLNLEADFIYQNGNYYLSYNGEMTKIINYMAVIKLVVSDEIIDSKPYYSLYVIDSNGLNTITLNCR